MLAVKEQHPELHIILLFQNPNNKLYKNSKTTYAMWAEAHDFTWMTIHEIEELKDKYANNTKRNRRDV